MTLISFLFICNQLKLRIFSNTFQSSAFDQTCLMAYITRILYLNARKSSPSFRRSCPGSDPLQDVSPEPFCN